jgi:hypothetical protein
MPEDCKELQHKIVPAKETEFEGTFGFPILPTALREHVKLLVFLPDCY